MVLLPMMISLLKSPSESAMTAYSLSVFEERATENFTSPVGPS